MSLFTPLPLEPGWQQLLRSLHLREVEDQTLGLLVERLSRWYHGEQSPVARNDELIARARFFFPRDIHKTALAAVELARCSALPTRPVRILDLGAGLGAASLGLVRAWHTAGNNLGTTVPVVERITAVDRSPDALDLARRIATTAASVGLLPSVPFETRVGDVDPEGAPRDAPDGATDVIVAANVLVEIAQARALNEEIPRGEKLGAVIDQWMTRYELPVDGVCIVIEPASRDASRTLHHARNWLIAQGRGVFAPCLHPRACPMLLRERDWCHEDLNVDLPPWLVPVARAAGLRWQGLTFSYLVVTPTPGRSVRTSLATSLAASSRVVPVRLVSTPKITKGKTEIFLCAEHNGALTEHHAQQLDRDVKGHPDSSRLSSCHRGDMLALPEAIFPQSPTGKVLRVGPLETNEKIDPGQSG